MINKNRDLKEKPLLEYIYERNILLGVYTLFH